MAKNKEAKNEWMEQQKKAEKNRLYKKIGLWVGAIVIVIASVWGLVMLTEPKTTPTESNIAPISKDEITIGKIDSKVKLVEYADFECPACATYNPLIKQAIEEYKEEMLFVYRNFPLPQHRNAETSARAAVAAYKQNKFMEMSSLLYQNQSEWANSNEADKIFKGYGEELKLDIEKFTKDYNSNETKNLIEQQKQEAYKAGINATPTFFLNGNQIQFGSYEELKQQIEKELNK